MNNMLRGLSLLNFQTKNLHFHSKLTERVPSVHQIDKTKIKYKNRLEFLIELFLYSTSPFYQFYFVSSLLTTL